MINRREILEKHSPCYESLNKKAPLSVGNGRFCFTADFTGLQTFFDEYSAEEDSFPLCTMAEWGWHSYPQPDNDKELLRLTAFDTYGRDVYYACDETGQEELFKRIRVNAHKFNLAKIGFETSDENLSLNNCKPVKQSLSLWEGILNSQFKIDGETVNTTTFVHPDEDTLYIKASSKLLKEKKLKIKIVFPYGSHKKNASDFSSAHLHTTKLLQSVGNLACIERKLDETQYKVKISGDGISVFVNEKEHTVIINPLSDEIEFSVKFEPGEIYGSSKSNEDSYEDALKLCRAFWERYWSLGGFIDFSLSKDSRANELERRIILSQYLIAIQSRGFLPPAETGLTCNSWYGKFHMEMYFWHHAHFALWGRVEELKRTLRYYKKILPVAKTIAVSQGYEGARWPKMCDPSGENTPSSVAVFLLWQQPHPIMLCELCWRVCPDESFLQEYRDVVIETADFMKSFVHYDNGRYVLGPPYIPSQESHDPKTVLNSGFELEYFRWGFKKADEWLNRLGEPPRYREIAENLSLPAVKNGLYLAHENCPDTFEKNPFYTDHPSMLAMYGVLDSEKINKDYMSATLDKVLEVWDKKTFYGWDFAMMAMTACRLGRYGDAVDLLLMESPKNTYLENGHNRMIGDNALPLYLPGNGAFLLAIGMLAAGFGDKKGSSFPDGFNIKTEGLLPYI